MNQTVQLQKKQGSQFHFRFYFFDHRLCYSQLILILVALATKQKYLFQLWIKLSSLSPIMLLPPKEIGAIDFHTFVFNFLQLRKHSHSAVHLCQKCEGRWIV